MMKALLIAFLSLGLLTGCGTLMPKKVELFQDKVEKFPDKKASEREVQREAAQNAAREANALVKAVLTNAPVTNVLKRAEATAELTDALSDSLGPPISPSKTEPAKLADKLNTTTGKIIERVFDFKGANNENAGKKIEGTGLIRVSYFAWVGGILVLLFLGYIALKVVATLGAAANPAVGVGVNAVSMGAKGIAKALSQVIKGGQKFKQGLDAKIQDKTTRDEILALFKASHKESQDAEVQKAVSHLTKE
jgi:hypothetical protein